MCIEKKSTSRSVKRERGGRSSGGVGEEKRRGGSKKQRSARGDARMRARACGRLPAALALLYLVPLARASPGYVYGTVCPQIGIFFQVGKLKYSYFIPAGGHAPACL